MGLSSKLALRLLALLTGTTVLVGTGALLPDALRSRFEDRLHSAQSRWARREFSEYRMVLQDDSGRCRQDVLVTDERVTQRLWNTCRIPPRTVGSLFRLIEGTPPSRYPCVEHRCACDTVVRVETDYDQALGYPRSIRFEWSVRASWHRLDYWGYVVSHGTLPTCRNTTFSRAIHVLSLEPIK
jgi:hypothetical protein